VAIKGKVYDVTGKPMYQPGGSYHGMSPCHGVEPHTNLDYMDITIPNHVANLSPVFAGKDASRALGKTSTKPEDVSPEWQSLDEKEKQTLNDWITFFSKRYNVVGVVAGATNME
jgi:hypothetical protein